MIDLDNLEGVVEHEYREAVIYSMPICTACKSDLFNKEKGRYCNIRGKVNFDDLQSENCIDLKSMCKDFEADKESCWYPMLMEHLEEAQKKVKK